MILLSAIAAAAAQSVEQLEDAIVTHIAGALSVPADSISVEHLGVGWTGCAEPEQASLHIESRADEDYLGPTDLRLTVRDAGTICLQTRMRPQIARWVTLPVATASVAPGAVIPMVSKRLQLTDNPGTTVDPSGGPYLARTALRAGEVVTVTRSRQQPDVSGGSAVVVEMSEGGLTIRCEGTLVGDGQLGQPVRARCRTTGRLVDGVLIRPDRVAATGG